MTREDPSPIPKELPLLPLPGRVMLPASLLQVRIPAKFRTTVSLAEHLVGKPAQASYVAVVPLILRNKDTAGAASTPLEQLNADDLLDVGTVARVVQVSRSPQHGEWMLTLEGVCRVHIGSITRHDGQEFHSVDVAPADSVGARSHEAAWDKQVDLLHKQVARAGGHLFTTLQAAVGVEGSSAATRALSNMAPAHAADLFLNLLATTWDDRIREQLDTAMASESGGRAVAARLVNHPALRAMAGGAGPLRGPAGPLRIGGPSRAGRDGGSHDDDDDVAGIMARLRAANPPAEVLKVAEREAKKLKQSADGHPAAATSKTYLETLADIPWSVRSHDLHSGGEGGGSGDHKGGAVRYQQPRTLQDVRVLLDKRHYGLDKIKDRIVQYVAVRRLRGWDAKAPILCFIGPPGVGKTSLAQSVAEVLGRPMHRISLGGVRDEAEIRGHRRTYVGAMPGRIIQGLKRCGVSDPVFVLDEIDKLGRDTRGDPAAALLEVLDPEQNHAFVDHYLTLPFDLSKIVFVATANQASSIPPPLLDRMEVIQLGGYTLAEKMHIAQRHLLPKLLQEHGLPEGQVQLPEAMLSHIIQHYTREAGVRSLSRCLSALFRHAAVQIVADLDLSPPLPPPPQPPPTAPTPVLAHHAPHDQSIPQPCCHDAACEGGGAHLTHPHHPPHYPPPPPPHPHHGQSVVLDGELGSCSCVAREGACGVREGTRVGAADGRGGGGEASYWDRLLVLLGMARQASGKTGLSRNHTDAPFHYDAPSHTNTTPAWTEGLSSAFITAAVGPSGAYHYLHHPAHTFPSSSSPSPSSSSSSPSSSSSSNSAHMPDTPTSHMGDTLTTTNNTSTSPLSSDAMPHQPPSDIEYGQPLVVDVGIIEAVLGPPKFVTSEAADRISAPGSAAGLVWTAAGGLVQYVECCAVGEGQDGHMGRLTLTGSMGEVLQESSRIALSWVRSHATQLGISDNGRAARQWDVHVHLPTGAVPKDGPSAGITLAVALVSLFTGRCCRADTAMTGELSLRGLVLPVGGIKEKLLAAYAAGMKRVLLSKRNERDVIAEVPANVLGDLQVVYCESVWDVLREAFTPSLLPHAASKL